MAGTWARRGIGFGVERVKAASGEVVAKCTVPGLPAVASDH
jgi:hypothetical protein